MAEFWNTIGIVMTQFLLGLSKIWNWLTNTQVWYADGMAITPIMLFGAGLGAFLVVIMVKELIF